MSEATVVSRKIVGLLADPGLPMALARKLQLTTAQLLSSSLDPEIEWTVEVKQQSLPLDPNGEVELNVHSQEVRDRLGWDYLIYLTDLPKYANSQPMISSINTGYGSAMIALPALGVLRKNRVRRVLLQTIGALHGAANAHSLGLGRISTAIHAMSPERTTEAAEANQNTYQTLAGIRGRVQLLAGMVIGNRPWRLLPGLSSAMAAAAATGAFGVFYTSIWSMADYLSPLRLTSISVLSIMIMTIWLITHNNLWERPLGKLRTERRVSYNLATVITILIAVAVMYLGLFTVIFGGALIIINSEYLSSQLGHPAGIDEYLNLAWLSASLGTIAGALGSSLDDEDSVKKATFSSREYDRRQLSEIRPQ
ncbi:hypothetical protein [Arthrobacter sp. AET 35A]|uniref:hypothetical protein n=1 Tax=Arthrobacter sp. AET 35A TaxID=2292643 RepID=UPI00178624C7|nr:hypothetical protein [Arthrobacter sp. AET 35A]MBE0011112.1 hypothetical protein [Arthrobacter sp. AET 35A]